MSQNASRIETQAQETFDWFQTLANHLRVHRQRLILSLQGEQAWCDQMVSIGKPQYQDWLVLSDRLDDEVALPFSKAETLLGQEASLVVVDLFQGLNPDVLCIASGLVKCGGLLVLLSVPPAQWSLIDDRYGVWQDDRAPGSPLFIEYFFNQLSQTPVGAVTLKQGEKLPPLPKLPTAEGVAMVSGKTGEQIEIQRRIDLWLENQHQSIALITADRGRGKSTCLGFIVQDQFAERQMSVLVTAHSRHSAAILLAQAGEVEFLAPDRLIASAPPADVLLIDEAAMLPYPMLEKLCRSYPRVLMATTTGGYEGTGQGFLLRFIARLPQDQVLRLNLDTPVRWAANDCLENWLNSNLLLKLPPQIDHLDDVRGESCRYRVLGARESSEETGLLSEIYSLMVSAHYRTRPTDLRRLMENPDLSVVLAEAAGKIIGVALLNREGGFDRPLCEQVFLGKRRPMGHLLAQMLTAQAGVRHFASHRGLRIQRIAVLSSNRRRGIGRRLVEAAIEHASEQGFDYIGASFAFEAETSAFWQRCGFSLVHIGFGRGKSSGNQSVAVLRSLNTGLDDQLAGLQSRIQQQLPVWLSQFLQAMDSASVAALLRYSQYRTSLSQLERDEVEAFARGHKGFELCFASLQRFVMQAIARMPEETPIHPWLIEKAVQNKKWDRLERKTGTLGRKQIQQKLRELIAGLEKARDDGG
ncbi:MAG: tRNA(Met) cytidine acetyltransferase [Proteobacteria bacterium]|nr:tRNA(Met) cytidine acetyltransferase [Pseudomonadota bacterium]